jgi:ribulose-5-phosphate 4-epimerase/fuculose-1-phosphate aldolase
VKFNQLGKTSATEQFSIAKSRAAYSGNVFRKEDNINQLRVGILSSHKQFGYLRCTENNENKIYTHCTSKYTLLKNHGLVYFGKHLVSHFFIMEGADLN